MSEKLKYQMQFDPIRLLQTKALSEIKNPKNQKQEDKKMSRLIVVIMQQEEYPFGECENQWLQSQKVMVRHRVEFHPFQKKNMLLKAKKVKSFINPYIIKLEQLFQEECSLHLFFQYVHFKIQTFISNTNTDFIITLKNQLFQLAEYLAENSILIDFKLRNIGMDTNYQSKYFIGLNYEIITHFSKDYLLQKYITQITEIISPYNLCQKKIPLTREPNPQFFTQKTLKVPNDTIKIQNRESFNEINIIKIPKKCSQTENNELSQKDFINKVTNFGENNLQLTFGRPQRAMFENLPKNTQTNMKIQHIGKKINDFKKLIKNTSKKDDSKKHDSVSLSSVNSANQERPSSNNKLLSQKAQSNDNFKVKSQNTIKINSEASKINNQEVKQTHSKNDNQRKQPQQRKLDKTNEKSQQINQLHIRTELKVNQNKKSYIYEFEKLLGDDFHQSSDLQNDSEPENKNVQGFDQLKAEKNSHQFRLRFVPVHKKNMETGLVRKTYSHAVEMPKKLSDRAKTDTSDIQERFNAVIGASKKLISTFRQSKASQKNWIPFQVE